ncbi:hypothetical protein G3580_16930 [Nitrogeniibacter mangrovi]|uniref:CdiI immunity protein domain-containing protein n=1 Tax=Nitrogeniibacter mangrovi TaxID=2016596 RepID=A0A6C1BA63_9RHOO|nr:contact-dependent growth inhibition system immunity protein [Nitrogeniibacter mangrovi]QID19154.1 hypothetical protein G3580_16930 [Nitrogeniibacter mangrovi]
MSNTAYPQLEQLLSGYFHQDWCEDHDTDGEVLTDYVQSTWRDEVMQSIDQLDRYLRDHPTELLAAFERDFTPMVVIGEGDDEARRWLQSARDQLAAQLESAPVRPGAEN